MAEKLKRAKANRDIHLNRLREVEGLAKRAVQDVNCHTNFKMRYLGLEATYASFEKQHFGVVDLMSNSDGADLAAEDAIRIEADNYYYNSLSAYDTLFQKGDNSTDQSQIQTPSVKLPKIQLPTFNGEFKSWPTFYDLFSSLIHSNTSLTNVEKYQYLLSALSKNVLPIVSGLPVTDSNYAIALDALVKRFQNKRLLATHYWKAIYDLEKLNTNSAHNLRSLLDTFCENLDALTNLNFPTDEWDFIMFNMLLQKVDSETLKRFELEYSCIELPTFKLLKDFLLKQCIALDSFALSSPSTSQGFNRHVRPQGHKGSTVLVTNPTKCKVCSQLHFITACPEFLRKTPNEKYSFAKQNKLCINCLKSSHSTLQCDSTYSCKKCKLKHHSLLHFPRDNETFQNHANALGAFAGLTQSPTTILLSTIRIDIVDCRGNVQTFRALLDSASQTNFITEKCFHRLGLTKINSNISIQGLGQLSSNVSGMVVCTIFPKGQVNPMFKIDAFIIPKICSSMPAFQFETNTWSFISNIKLADESFNTPGEIDMLLGAEIFSTCLQSGRLVGSANEPNALETMFGWVLMGKVLSPSTSSISLCATIDHSLNHILRKFWEIEEPVHHANTSADDLLCENNFDETHSRTDSGRYCVSLPFKETNPTFQDSRSVALRRFLNLERRLVQNPELYQSYSEFMLDYRDTGHMSIIQGSNDDRQSYFIPHHAILRPDSSTTKLRVVFDASAKAANDVLLNDTLLTGPTLQPNIVSILLNFRVHKYVLTADIKQMYRQILVTPDHRTYQKILWRFSAKDPIQEYCLNTVTYGVSSAPYLALRTIQQLVKDEGSLFPFASKVLTSHIFVDDILASCRSIDEAQQLRIELVKLLSKGGFELRKWASNEPSLLSDMPDSMCSSKSLDMEPDSFVKILGLQWHPTLDHFSFKVVPREENCTKRGMLSELARVYDPLGFLSPLSFFTKYLISQLWTLGLDWDAPPPSNICSKWTLYRSQLSSLSSMSIPRQVIDTSHRSFQLHGFSDASERGYAAVIYVRTIDSNNCIDVKLVMAKSKVAPQRRITLPRLELCAAVLLSDLISYVFSVYQNIEFELYAWSDSMVTLSWIKSSPQRWKCFVSNRVSHIQENTTPSIWHHVRSEDNPADCASRGLMPAELVNHSLWWAGPKWLCCNQESWSTSSSILVSPSEIKEEERNLVLNVNVNVNSAFPLFLLAKYSSLSKIKRIICYFLRFLNNTQRSKPKQSGPLVEDELYQALVFLVKNVQAEVFSRDITNLRNKIPILKPLRKLAPFLDANGVLRVGGRLSNSALDYDKRFPILLPRSHRVTELIIEEFHKNNLHPGLQTLHFLINQQFWILSAKQAIRSILSKCIKCYKANPKPVHPLMGDLPASRVNQVKPFSCTGVDMAGPFLITMSKRRGSKSQKAYLCLFVCFVTKALHLEVTSDLSTESFLAALQRFIARRGRCNTLFSDQGTNFIGANRELLKCMKDAAEEEKLSWSFNPPSAPHFGGLWEAGVKSVKTHFFRVVGSQILTYEELYTVFVKIEAILNSRPLCSISSDPADLSALTPGHFLVLEPLTTIPSPDLTNLQLNRLSRWQLIQRLSQDFWKRWHQEYLHSLQQRSKWNKSTTSIELNMLVLIKNDNLLPLQWRLGRVIELHKGNDGVCRVCTVRTSQGTFQRPVVKLCPLPIY